MGAISPTLACRETAPHARIFYIAGNLTMGGVGDPPGYDVRDPDDWANDSGPSVMLNKILHDGIIYTKGILDKAGVGLVYGAVYAEGGFGSAGCPEVYYNEGLRNYGLQLESGVGIVMWKIE